MTDITPTYPILSMKEKVIVDETPFGQSLGGLKANATSIQQGSGNEIYKVGTEGLWLGAAEFQNAPFSVSMAGAIKGVSLAVSQLDIPNTTNAQSFHTDSLGNSWWGDTALATAPASITNTGDITGSSVTITGGAISGITLNSIQSGSEIAIQGWQQDMAFSSTDYQVVAWASGTITLLDGTTYSITGANTGNMTALTYIYLDIGTSTTVLQHTTTPATAVGSGKILIAVAQNNSDTTSKATLQVFGGKGGQMVAIDNLVANSASTNELISNTAQIKDAVITDLKITGTILVGHTQAKCTDANADQTSVNTAADASAYTGTSIGTTYTAAKCTDASADQTATIIGAGLITTGYITLNIAGHIKSGQTAYATGTGWWLGNDAGTPKYSIGDATHYFRWTGSAVDIVGATLTSGIIQTATSGQRIRMITDAGSTPTQLANSLALINSSNDILFSFGSSNSAVQEITPVTNINALNIINKTGTSYASDLLYVKIVGAGSSGECLDIENAGTGHCIKLENTGTGGHLEFIPKATFTSSLSEGLCYADTDHHLKYYNGSEWLNLTEENTDGSVASLLAGETIGSGKALMVASATTGHQSLKQYYNDTASAAFGKATGNYDKVGQYFLSNDLNTANVSGLWINTVRIRVRKVGTPTDNIQVSIQADVSNAPSGTPLASGTIAGGDITTSYDDYAIDIGFLALTAGLGYNIVFERSGSGDDTDYYEVSIGVNGYANGNRELLPVGGNWSGSVDDLNFDLRQTYREGSIYIATAKRATSADTFIGFATESITAETTTKSYQIAGEATPAQGSLTAGVPYYLSDTFGAIATSAGTVSKKVGLSLSTTKLQVLNVV